MRNSKNIYILILFFIGLAITLPGAIFKLLHWPGAHLMLMAGMILQAAAILLLVTTLIKKISKRTDP